MASRTTTDPIEILLEMGVDLDNLSEEEDYLSALMEAVNSLTIKDASDPRIGFLADEIRKVRQKRKEADPKFKAKKTKISANSLKSTPRLAAKTTKISPQKLLPGSTEVGKEEPEQDSIIKILTDISESVKSILYSLKASNNISKNLAEDERKRQESKKRSGAESKLEKKRFEGLKKLGGKLIEPIKGPLEMLFNFLKNVILGKIVLGIIDWLGDPENQKKLESLGRFFMDWWPTIVTAVLLFGTGLGGLLKSIVGITFKFIPKLLGLLPGLLKFLKSPMGRIAGLAVAGAGLAGRMMDGGEDDVDLTKQDPAPQKMMDGGLVPGEGPNKDTVPAMLAPGEFVMSRGAVQKYGADTMASMNAAGGGTNLPQRMNGITYAAGGGMIGDDGKEKASPKLAREMEKRDKTLGVNEEVKSDTASKRHAELMKTTNPQRIADYDAKHGQGAYSKKLREKLEKTYSTPSPSAPAATAIKSTGKVVGRENLPPATRALLEKMDAQRASGTADMMYSKKGGGFRQRISAEDFNRVKGMVGAAKEGGAKGVLNHMLSGAKSMFGGMIGKVQGAVNDPKSFVESMGGTVRDGNVGRMTPQLQKEFDKLNAARARADKLEAENKAMSTQGGLRKQLEKDPLFAEYERAFDDPKHPLHDKVAGDLFDDTGTKHPLRFEEFKKLKAQQKNGGGEVKESSGQNFAGGTADRQLIKAQPGEYMLPVDTVNNLGGPARLDQLVANTDSNSTPAKLGMRSRKTPQVGPPMPMQPQINLIPTPTGGSKGYGDSSGSALPNFDAGIGDPNKAKLLGVVR
ncbi:hypothetical protein HOR89_gp012 [Synechococcus phage Bellamy]|uniref:Uncharacterized protein n=1 Tax=Synechococcus phage Bellamy TaxID=2023996 RepID=A0A222YWV8_9CAUD|nr:hypothetical protein HOR89_gp012 [Synechococcus phage Bellamy]ASR76059.1 hypothetical protein PBI_BELLAMY_12 [Synechococcus phage Bellamy]